MGEVGATQSPVEVVEPLASPFASPEPLQQDPDFASLEPEPLEPVLEETETSEIGIDPDTAAAEGDANDDKAIAKADTATDAAAAPESVETVETVETDGHTEVPAANNPGDELQTEAPVLPPEDDAKEEPEADASGQSLRDDEKCSDSGKAVAVSQDADANGSDTGPLDISDAQTLLCEELPVRETTVTVPAEAAADAVAVESSVPKDQEAEDTNELPEVPLPSETVLLPGSPTSQGQRSPMSKIPEAVFYEVPLMPPETFFDPAALERFKEEAMSEYSDLLSWLLSPLDCADPEKALRRHQEEEEEEAECRTTVLRVARRQMWRERSRINGSRQSQTETKGVTPQGQEMRKLQSQLADMREEVSALVETIDERKAELNGILKQQQEMRGEITTWNTRVTELEARAVDQRMAGKVLAPQQAPVIFRAESLPTLWKAPSPAAYPHASPIPAWAQRAWAPTMPSTPSPVPHAVSPSISSPGGPAPAMPLPVPSPGRTVAGLGSPGGIGSPPCRVVSWSPRSPWSPVVPVGGSALLPPRVAGSPQQHPHVQHAQLRPGSMVVPAGGSMVVPAAGSLQLPPGQPKAAMVPNLTAARMVTSFSTGQLPKMATVAQAPQSPVRPGAPSSPCQSFRQISPVRVPL